MKLGSSTAALTTSISSTFRFTRKSEKISSSFTSTLSFFGCQRSMSQLPLYCSAASLSSSSVDSTNDSSVKPNEKPWLLVGLGNPGKMYQRTRHNVGFEMVDAIAEAEGISMSSVSFKALFGKGFIGNVPVMLAKPQTFMNASGESVKAIVSYYKIPLKQVLLIYDDLDLPFAKLRLLPKGGHGGHNGMRSVIDRLKGNRDFPRLRIGIGRPPGKMDSANFVLRPFNKQEREELDFTFERGVEATRILILDGFNKSATFVNTTKSMEQFS
ncbi:peptidyl-tRNA hydrolase, mitochondrial-like [Euphorbia lathyris]|uniref:peptidyl-tRNA hydrolase, mitochondrial-like n=1 Tax=Euphorbia lathyris TaxID=212925 RepID=UPI00331417A8